METHLRRAVAFFGADRDLASIRPPEIRRWVEELRLRPNGRGQRCPECDERGEVSASEPVATCPDCGDEWTVGTLSDSTVRDHLNSLSNLYRRAQGEEAVPSGHNPVAAWLGSVEDSEKPTGTATREAEWLEPEEAALLLEAARKFSPDDSAGGHNFVHELLATALLTGGRKSEVLGLEVEDVSFDRDVIRFRENEHRGLKTKTSTRTVPLWPQLREILQPYVFDPERSGPTSGLLFPSPRTGEDARGRPEAARQGGGAGGIREGRGPSTEAPSHLHGGADSDD